MRKVRETTAPLQSKPRGRPRGDARARILKAARKLLATQRYDVVSVPDIVAEAGVAQGTFYLYFTAKAELIGALTEEVQATLEAKISSCLSKDAPVIAILGMLLDAGASVCRDYADILPFLGSEGLLFGSSERAEEMKTPYHARLAALIRRDQDASLVRRDIAPRHAARLIVATLDQVARDLSRHHDAKASTSYRADAISFLKHALSK